jgi:hypothetical protein
VFLFAPNVDAPLDQVPANGGTAVAVTALDSGHGEKVTAGRNSVPMARTTSFLTGLSTGGTWEFT